MDGKEKKKREINLSKDRLFKIFCILFIFSSCADFEDIFTPGSQASTRVARPPHHSLKKEARAPAEPLAPVVMERFIWPVKGRVTSPFGTRHGRPHDGIDISSPRGTPIQAAADGTVLYVGRLSGYGNLLILKHPGNFFTAYAHLSQTHVRKGDRVRQGKIIGNVGRTGRATGAHLHFEVRLRAVPQNPLDFLPPAN